MNSLFAALINGGIAGALTSALVWIVLRLTPRRALNATTRYAIWWMALALVMVLPAFFVPKTPADPSSGRVFISPPTALPAPAQPSLPVPVYKPIAAPRSSAFRMPNLPLQLPSVPWPRWVLAAWAGISLILLFRLALSFLLLERVRSRATDVASSAREIIRRRITRSLGDSRAMRLLASQDISTPIAVGPWSPTILIPAALCQKLELEELEQIGLHEAAHLTRRDDYALILQRVIEAVFALHPVVRWLSRRIDLEREIACDDMVVAATGNAVSYATCLLRVVELSGGVRPSLAAATAGEDNSHLSRRVSVLLDQARNSRTAILKVRLLAMAGLTLAIALGAGQVSRLVAFPSKAPRVTVRSVTVPAAKVTILPLQAAALPNANHDLTGMVLEDSTGTPVVSAELRFRQTGVHELAADIETDRMGRFTVPSLQAGEYAIEVLKPNFAPTAFRLKLPSGSPVIRLVRYGVIDGQVADERGRPLPARVSAAGGNTIGAARITVLTKDPNSEELQTFREVTLDEGHYRIYDLPPGDYVLSLWYNGLGVGAGLQLYPDNTHPRVFSVLGGEEFTNINFNVVQRPMSQVSGKIVPPEGLKGRFQIALGLPEQPALPVAQVLTDEDGTFRLDKVPPGSYELFVAGPTGGYGAYDSTLRAGTNVFGRASVQVTGQNLDDVAVPLTSGRTMTVKLSGGAGEKIPAGCPKSSRISLKALDPWAIMFNTSVEAGFVKEQSFTNLAPGRFRLVANDLGAECFQVNPVVVNLAGDPATSVVVEVASAGSIKGTMRQPQSNPVGVVLLPAGTTDGGSALIAYPDADGGFRFGGLRPGRYTIAARTITDTKTRWVSRSRNNLEIDVKGGVPTSIELAAPATEGGRQ